MKSKKAHQAPTGSRRKKWLIFGGIGLWCALWVLGAPQFTFHYARCGGKMPITHTVGFFSNLAAGNGSGYLIPSDRHYYQPPYLWDTTYYCTEQEAIDDYLVPDMTSNYEVGIPSDTIFTPEKAKH